MTAGPRERRNGLIWTSGLQRLHSCMDHLARGLARAVHSQKESSSANLLKHIKSRCCSCSGGGAEVRCRHICARQNMFWQLCDCDIYYRKLDTTISTLTTGLSITDKRSSSAPAVIVISECPSCSLCDGVCSEPCLNTLFDPSRSRSSLLSFQHQGSAMIFPQPL
jgi:hypothetical protein